MFALSCVSRQVIRKVKFSTLPRNIIEANSPNAVAPLVEKYRNVWPDPEHALIGEALNIPERTVPESSLRWQLTANFSQHNNLFYKHLTTDPQDSKVGLLVYMKDLNLTKDEKQIFLQMVGKRFNAGKQEVKLTARKFQNRMENKKYLTLMLEQLLAEAKNLNKLRPQYPNVAE